MPRVILASLLVLSAGCSLLVRPTPDAPRNVTCAMEYRPDPGHDGPDIVFMAGARPYRDDEAWRNLFEHIVHGLFAPGRHLIESVDVQGARCEGPLWEKGHRLPPYWNAHHNLLCRREGAAAVRFEVRTKWGTCRQEIAANDLTPKCLPWGRNTAGGLDRMSQRVCAPQP